MDGIALLERIGDLGIEARVDGTTLVLTPRSLVPANMIEEIRACKAEIMDLLTPPRPVAPWTTPAEYLASFMVEHDPYTCPRCGDPVLLENLGNDRKRYTDWFDGQPHRLRCRGRR